MIQHGARVAYYINAGAERLKSANCSVPFNQPIKRLNQKQCASARIREADETNNRLAVFFPEYHQKPTNKITQGSSRKLSNNLYICIRRDDNGRETVKFLLLLTI